MKQSHTSRLQRPKVRQVPNGFAGSEPAWITPASVGMEPGRDHFAAMTAPADRQACSFASGWFKVLSFSGRGSHYSGNGGSNYSIIPQGGD